MNGERDLRHAEPGATMLLGDRDAREAGVADRLPDRPAGNSFFASSSRR